MKYCGRTLDAATLCKSFAKGALVAAALGLSINPATGVAHADSGVNWDTVAECESGGDWSADTGNGFYGGLQFKPSTWDANGGVGSPASASRDEQIAVAERVLASQGPEAWPKCGPDHALFPMDMINMLLSGHPVHSALQRLWSLAIPH
jgi:hypothetical protein